MWGVRDWSSCTPDRTSLGRAAGAPYPQAVDVVCGPGGLGFPWHLPPCRGSSCIARASLDCGTRWPLLLGTCPDTGVVAGGVPLWRASWPCVGALRLVQSSRSRCSGRLSRSRDAFPRPGAPGLFRVDANTSFFGSEDATLCLARVCPCVLFVTDRAGRLPVPVLVCLTFPLAALSFCFARAPPGWVALLVRLFAFFSFSVLPFVLPLCGPVVSCFLWFSAPGALGLGAVCSSPPLPLVFFLLACLFPFPPFFFLSCFFFLSPPACCAQPPPLPLFVLWVSCCSTPCVLSLLCVSRLDFGCSPVVAAPPLFCVSHGFRRCRSVFHFFVCCFAPACLLGIRRRSLPTAAPRAACTLPCAVWCCRAVLRFCRSFCAAMLPCSLLRVVLWCLALLCRGLLRAVRCALGRVFVYCAVLLVAAACCAVSLVVLSGGIVCGVLCCLAVVCVAMCCAVLCPWMQCCAALLRVVPASAVLL